MTRDEGRAICGALTAIMTGVAYATSAEMAGELGALPRLRAERASTCCASSATIAAPPMARPTGYEALSHRPGAARPRRAAPTQRLVDAAPARAWDEALALGEQHGYRNAQVTVIAPTGTIGLVMDCDTTGIEPDFALVKFKKLAGGGYFKIINRAVPEALRTLGYREAEIAEIEAYAVGHGILRQAPAINHATLQAKGFTDEKLAALEKALAVGLRHQVRLQQVDARRGLPDRARSACRPSKLDEPAFDLLTHLGFSKADIEAANIHVCGAMTLEGAPLPQGRASAGVRLRQPLRPHRQALPLGREPHPHDGGGAALHLGRHLQDHQHAERRDGRGLQGGLHAVLAARR